MLKAVLLKEAPQVVISIAVVCSRIVCLQFMRIQIEIDCFQIAPLHISHLPAASKRDAIEREFFRMLNDEQKRKYLDLESAVILAECDIAEAMYMKGAADREMMIR